MYWSLVRWFCSFGGLPTHSVHWYAVIDLSKTQISHGQASDGDEISDGYQTLFLGRLFILLLFIIVIKKIIIISYRVGHAVDPRRVGHSWTGVKAVILCALNPLTIKIPYWWRSSTGIRAVSLISCCWRAKIHRLAKTNEKHYPDLCRATSSARQELSPQERLAPSN